GGKWIAARLTQKVFHYSVLQRNVLFGLTTARAAATLAVILVGFQVGIINDTVLNGTIILILITCLISSFITEESGRKLAIQESEAAPEIRDTPEKILVPISNPETIVHLMDFAIMIRNTKSSDPIYALTIVKDNEEADERVHKSNEMLEDVVKHASGTDSEVQVITRIALSVVSGISRTMKEIKSSDLIMGWSTRISNTDRLFGSKIGFLLLKVWKNIYVYHTIIPTHHITSI